MLVRPSIIIIEGNKVLLMRYKYGGNEVFALPGGNPGRNETLEKTLIRELKEELNLDIQIDRLAFMGEVILPGKREPTLHCAFLGSTTSGRAEINPGHTKALDFAWMDVNELDIINIYPNIGHYIKNLVQNKESAENPYIGQINQKWF